MAETEHSELLTLTADIVAAHVGNNSVAIPDLSGLIASVHGALVTLGRPAAPAVSEAQKPAVPIRASVKPDYIVCLEDGKKLTMLKRHLRTTYDLSPREYRAKWNLPADYPMVAPAYAERRRVLAHSIGLGRKKAVPVELVPEQATAKPKGRRAAPADGAAPRRRQPRATKPAEPAPTE